jgi:hypothetical protein
LRRLPYAVDAECGDPVPYEAASLTVLGAVAAAPSFTG